MSLLLLDLHANQAWAEGKRWRVLAAIPSALDHQAVPSRLAQQAN